jgi:hypothetical protein
MLNRLWNYMHAHAGLALAHGSPVLNIGRAPGHSCGECTGGSSGKEMQPLRRSERIAPGLCFRHQLSAGHVFSMILAPLRSVILAPGHA